MDRIKDPKSALSEKEKQEKFEQEERFWVSYRGQTLARTG